MPKHGTIQSSVKTLLFNLLKIKKTLLARDAQVILSERQVKIMNKYESIIIINPSVDEEQIKALTTKFTEMINSDGKVEKAENLGKKKLAYPVKKNAEGYYVVFNFTANPSIIAELERNYRITDDVIKFMTINVNE